MVGVLAVSPSQAPDREMLPSLRRVIEKRSVAEQIGPEYTPIPVGIPERGTGASSVHGREISKNGSPCAGVSGSAAMNTTSAVIQISYRILVSSK